LTKNIETLEMMAEMLLDEIRKLKPKEERPRSKRKEIEERAKKNWLKNKTRIS